MKWIRKLLGISDMIEQQKRTNELLKAVIHLQKHQIQNDCVSHSEKQKLNNYAINNMFKL